MKPHQERVVTEKSQAIEKIDKLRAFLSGDVFLTLLPGMSAPDLRCQLGPYAQGYSAVFWVTTVMVAFGAR